MTIKIVPYKPGSRSARDLSEALGAKRLKTDGTSRWQPRYQDVVINWGAGRFPFANWRVQPTVLNLPERVTDASNKYRSVRLLEDGGVRVPDWTDNPEVVLGWLNEGHTVLARTLLNASGGRGIIKLTDPKVDIPRAPLYNKYVPKASEWRVHVGLGCEVIDVQQKVARAGVEPNDWQIRNHENGFIFQRGFDRARLNNDVLDQARDAVLALGLDFGAVDVIWNNHRGQAYVLEVNTAPGLEGQTLENYARMFENYV